MNAAEGFQQELERRRREEELLGDPEYVAWLSELLTKAQTNVFNPNQGDLFNEISRERIS